MGLEYVNRKGDRYYLLHGTTKTGKPKYYCSRKQRGAQLDEMPAGFEWRENPVDAQVTVRRKIISRITDAEQALVAQGVRDLAGLKAFVVDVEKDALVVYTADQSSDSAERIVEMLSEGRRLQSKVDWFIRQSKHSAMLRFHLQDEESRDYAAERWCFRGSVDDWIFLHGPAPLPELVEEYVPHLGSESFFELM